MTYIILVFTIISRDQKAAVPLTYILKITKNAGFFKVYAYNLRQLDLDKYFSLFDFYILFTWLPVICKSNHPQNAASSSWISMHCMSSSLIPRPCGSGLGMRLH